MHTNKREGGSKEKIRSFVANESAPKTKNTFTSRHATGGESFAVLCFGSGFLRRNGSVGVSRPFVG